MKTVEQLETEHKGKHILNSTAPSSEIKWPDKWMADGLFYLVCSDTEYFDVFTAPDGPPQDVTLEPTSPQSIKVSWKVKSKLYVLLYKLRH